MIRESPVISFLRVELWTSDDYQFIWGVSKWGDNFGDGSPSYGWEDYTCGVTQANINRGGIKDVIKNNIDVGTLSMVMKDINPNIDRNLYANAKIRVINTLNDKVLFTGKIADYDLDYSFDKNTGNKITWLTVLAVDAISNVAKTNRFGAGAVGASESWEDRIARLAESTQEDIELPVEGAGTVIYSLYTNIWLGPGGGGGLDFDGWTRFGGLAANSQVDVWSPQIGVGYNGLMYGTSVVISYNWATPFPVAANTYGLKRTITGLTIGKTYRLNARGRFMAYDDTGAVISGATKHVDQYQLGVIGIGYGSNGNITNDYAGDLPPGTTAYDLPEYEFVATSTSHEIAIRMSEAISRTHVGGGLQQFELFREIWESITVTEDAGASDYQLRSLKYESSLRNHFNVACDSIGAFWWVDANNVIRFKADLDNEGIKEIFTDKAAQRDDGALSYIDIDQRLSTRDVANDIAIINHGIKDDPENPGETLVDDQTTQKTGRISVLSYGAKAASIDISLKDDGGYVGSVDNRGQVLLDEYRNPKERIYQITWNVQEDTSHLGLVDLYDQVMIYHDDRHQQSRVTGIKHRITPTRMITTYDVMPDFGAELVDN